MRRLRALMIVVMWTVWVVGTAQAQQLERTVEELAIQISNSLEAENKKRVAILSLTDLGGSQTPLGMLIAEELTNQLFLLRGARFDVVERARVEAIFKEQELAEDGVVAPEDAARIGKLVGADAVLSGSIAELDDRLRVNARLMAVPSGQLFATASTFMLKTSVPVEMMRPVGRKGNQVFGAGGAIQTRTAGNVSFDLIACSQSTRLISCRLLVTNNHADMNFWIAAGVRYDSAMFDQMGRKFMLSAIKMLGLEDNYIQIRLISEVPTEVELQFQGVPSTIEFIKILSIHTSVGQIEFRDIRFSG